MRKHWPEQSVIQLVDVTREGLPRRGEAETLFVPSSRRTEVRLGGALHHENDAHRLPVVAREGGARHLAAEVLPAPVDGVERDLRGALAAEHVADGLPQLVDREADVETEEVLLARLLGSEAPHVLGQAVPALHREVPIE